MGNLWKFFAGFLFTFSAYTVLERHVGASFESHGSLLVGLGALAALYLALFLGNAISPMIIRDWLIELI